MNDVQYADWLLGKAILVRECLECHFSKSTHGYCKVGKSGEDQELAHRFIYRAKRGPIGSLWVLHSCDNRGCINPEHLWLGTQDDNDADRDRKGRTSDQGRPRAIDDEELTKIMDFRKQGLSYQAIADMCKVSRDTIRNAIGVGNYARKIR